MEMSLFSSLGGDFFQRLRIHEGALGIKIYDPPLALSAENPCRACLSSLRVLTQASLALLIFDRPTLEWIPMIYKLLNIPGKTSP